MLIPSIFGENLLDDSFDYSLGSHKAFDMMSTNIRGTRNGYEITMNMSGVRKEDVKAELKDGYLTIQTTTDSSRDEEGSNGAYIRRGRYYGSCNRSFYVDDAIVQEDIKAKFENGTLEMLVPRKEAKPAVEEKEYITIEGQTQI